MLGNHHGDALNVAARVQGLACPGGLAVSERVYRALDEPALRFWSLGSQSLKNIPERVGVYQFRGLPTDGDRADVRPAKAGRRAFRRPTQSVAVADGRGAIAEPL